MFLSIFVNQGIISSSFSFFQLSRLHNINIINNINIMNNRLFFICGGIYVILALAIHPVTRMVKLFIMGLTLAAFGLVLCFTKVGFQIGIPVITIGVLLLFIYLLYSNLSNIYFNQGEKNTIKCKMMVTIPVIYRQLLIELKIIRM